MSLFENIKTRENAMATARKKKTTSKKANPRTVLQHKLVKQHLGHAQHMCNLVQARKMDKVATLSKGAKYVCHICGRAAAKATNLCEAVEI